MSSTNKIKEIYYINVEFERDRNLIFLENYNKNSLEIPIYRIKGIVPHKGNGKLSLGELGCALSHIKVMKKISLKPPGWYLVCEDDCSGNFKLIEDKIKIVTKLHPFVNFINLHSPYKIPFSPGTGSLMTGYLITPFGAKLSSKIIQRQLLKYPCDMSLCYSLIHFLIGFRFNNILYPNNMSSTINKLSNFRTG